MKHILIVEDEKILAQTLRDNLVAKGYSTEIAENGERALERIRMKKPDLVLLDLLMPRMDGFAVLRALKADERTKFIPVIVLTVLGYTADIAKALEAGATTYLLKVDNTIDEVIKKIQEQL